MKNRIAGFDLARAYAILGMFIVNFNTVFGSHTNHSGLSGFLNLFNGNSSTLFVMLAGMGISLMTGKANYTAPEKNKLKAIITKRSWFLFVLGILFYLWWPADILHFYGGYMHIAVLFVFMPKKYFLYAAGAAVIIFHILLFVIPYETGWNFSSFIYHDFWTLTGFFRNTFYNGWNAIFPWIAFFLLGMYVGRLNWQHTKTPWRVFLTGFIVYVAISLLQNFAGSITSDKELQFYLTADYLPPFLPFMMGTASFGLMLISICIGIGNKFGESSFIKMLTATGQMTLTHYIAHLFAGLLALSFITGKTLSYNMLNQEPAHPLTILLFAIAYFMLSCLFSYQWAKKYKNGPLETLMRKITG
jgi:uncharacterized protein